MYLQLFLSKTILKNGKGYIWEVIPPKKITLKGDRLDVSP